ncbi:MAG: hypothetical protein A2X13_04720 [Bacteroidetes bacterium GWC2_33_15]|nr:MAG: hypothetical protein A2X10_06565 [Bacteroidetes bacterium GWA2_33_15]OFX49829.1 MAG: hypothetical protein A2X13_04720 [Bacteroidetes bacterium GWC2_33_15]OFX65020.1 MAG: hypothetical protein A2X15_06640 [Bacteroidetes bacterium GWB2_32_14]OFX69018.1 MAG: hypothetical protein A2X14_13515 [Bacteroidetes bacterium GWD2_33_33]HAN18285.1 hypothetical protein [Bacteroidales bacterium]
MKNHSSFLRKYTVALTVLVLVLIFTFTSCQAKTTELEKFLNRIEIQYEQISIELGTAYWNFYSGEGDADLVTPKNKYYTLLINDTLNNYIDTWYPKRSEISDTILRRRIEVWHNTLLSAKVEYNAEVMKLRNELEEMLKVTDENNNKTDNFSGKMLLLIQLRNKKAQELGFENYVHLSFENNGLGYKWFTSFVENLDKATLEPYKALVEKAKTEKQITQFDQRSAFQFVGMFYANNTPPEPEKRNIDLVKESLANIGIDYTNLPSKLVEKQLPEGVGGQGIMLNIPYDFRAVMTLGMDISVWMHEMGHGLHGLYNSINSPILEGYEWIPGNSTPAFSEGMAETSAGFTQNTEWLKKYTSLTEEDIQNREEIINTYAPAFIRYHLSNFMKEMELYLNPDKSYEEIQKDVARKYMLIETDDIRTQELKNIIYVSYPLYLQNYLIADIIAGQVHQAMEEKFGTDYAFNKETGNYLQQFYKGGEYFTWQQRMVNGTGKELDVNAYLKRYNIK